MQIIGRFGGAVIALSAIALSGCSGMTEADTSKVDASCEPRHDFGTLKDGVLTVSTYTYAPATIVDGDKLTGVEGELLDQIAEWECVTINVQEQAAAGVIAAVQANRADLAAGSWYRTQDRADVLNLTDPIYTDSMVFSSAGGTVGTVDQLEGLTVGTFEGNLWNEDLEALLGTSLKVYPTEQATFQDLKNGRVDVAVDGAGGTTNMLTQMGTDEFQPATPPADDRIQATIHPGQIGWPVTKSNTELVDALNADIAELRESGRVAELLKKYGYPDSAGTVGEPDLL